MFDANKAYYVKKWGGLPGHETFTVAFGTNKVTVAPGSVWQPSPTSVAR
jgi:hypothetical protein